MGENNSPKKISSPVPAKQIELRRACQTGDVRKAASLLTAQHSLWKAGIQRLVGSWVLRRFGVHEDWLKPARLDFVYDDEEANMPIHYIALGSPVSLVSRLLSSLCIRGAGAGHASDRAALLRFLLDKGYQMDLTSVNARLETPLHCALRSRSLEILEVLLTHRPAMGSASNGAPVTEKDSESRRPLDVALVSQQWPAVRLLIAAGALSKCPELDDARRELNQLLPAADEGAKNGGVLSVLPSALGKVFNFVLRQGQDPRPSSPPQEQSTFAESAAPAESEDCSTESKASIIVLANNAEIARHQQRSVEHIKYVLDVTHARALALLEANQWNEHRTVDAYFIDPEGALRAAGVSTDGKASTSGAAESSPEASAPAEDASSCIVCFESVNTKKLSITLPCGHITCDTCWKGILKVRLSEGDVHRTGCPFVGCSYRLSLSEAQQLLSKQQRERFEQLLAQNYADTNPAIKWCPRAGCGRCLTVDARVGAADGVAAAAGNGRALDVRCSCGHPFCFSCLRAPHEPATCAAVREWEALVAVVHKEIIVRDEGWLARNTKPCCGCGAPIQKNGGCNHMICSRCRRHFCWICGSDWASHNSATGGFYKCNRFRAAVEEEAAGQEGGAVGLRSFLGSVFGRIQDAATRFRLNYYLRRYHASECDARQLHVAAEWMSALLTAGLPLNHGRRQGEAHAVNEQEAFEAAEGSQPPAKVGLGELLEDMSDTAEAASASEPCASSPAASASKGKEDHCAAHEASSEHAHGMPEAVSNPMLQMPKRQDPADLGYLKLAAAEAIAAREVLRNSYIAGFSLVWGDRRRSFEEIQGRLEAATEQCSGPLALLPDIQAIMQAGGCRVQPQDSGYLPASTPNRPLPLHVQDGEMLRRQFYFALAVHERAVQLRSLSETVAAEKRLLLTSARRGLFEERAEASMDAAVATGMLPLTAEEVQADGGTIGGALQTAGAALAYFWHGG